VGKDVIKGKGRIEKEAEVTVPAGKYKTTVVVNDVEVNGQKLSTTYYLAKDVGMVKQTLKLGELDVTLELEKFELGK
jgi:hypothetical protein